MLYWVLHKMYFSGGICVRACVRWLKRLSSRFAFVDVNNLYGVARF